MFLRLLYSQSRRINHQQSAREKYVVTRNDNRDEAHKKYQSIEREEISYYGDAGGWVRENAEGDSGDQTKDSHRFHQHQLNKYFSTQRAV